MFDLKKRMKLLKKYSDDGALSLYNSLVSQKQIITPKVAYKLYKKIKLNEAFPVSALYFLLDEDKKLAHIDDIDLFCDFSDDYLKGITNYDIASKVIKRLMKIRLKNILASLKKMILKCVLIPSRKFCFKHKLMKKNILN